LGAACACGWPRSRRSRSIHRPTAGPPISRARIPRASAPPLASV